MEARAEARNLRMQMEDIKNGGGGCGGGGGGKEQGFGNPWQVAASTGSLPQLPLYQQQNAVALHSGYNGGGGGGGDSAMSASMLFLQWQNAHLNAELRSAQQALATTRAELQVQAMNAQTAEKKHLLLMERAEHLELDLGFRAALGGFSGFGGGGGGGGGILGISAPSAIGGGGGMSGASPYGNIGSPCARGGPSFGGAGASTNFGGLGGGATSSSPFFSAGGSYLAAGNGATLGGGLSSVGLGAGHGLGTAGGGGFQDVGLLGSVVSTMPGSGLGVPPVYDASSTHP
mmetsp:Transcript_100642/g.290737  ORF Transcript_100642/g.290737 Transcript_100642/m.290737 type:complete len:288 (+) Transcript_100642:109-972(+)